MVALVAHGKGIEMATEMKWPNSYISAINEAVNLSLSLKIEHSLSAIETVEKNFLSHKVFEKNSSEFNKSIFRNKLLALTLSGCSDVKLLLLQLFLDMITSNLFGDVEITRDARTIVGKINSVEGYNFQDFSEDLQFMASDLDVRAQLDKILRQFGT